MKKLHYSKRFNNYKFKEAKFRKINFLKNKKNLTKKKLAHPFFASKRKICIIIKIICLLILILLVATILAINKLYNVKEIFQFIINLKNGNGNFFFFEKNQHDLVYCNNYGLMIYNYNFDKGLSYGNIGDYIQSLAALQYLPKNCKPYLINRDEVGYYHGEKVKLIFNSWNNFYRGNKNISDKINPIYISYHIRKNYALPSVYINNLKKYAPIGCRDKATRDNFIKYGINAYFSSCLTTTLDIDYAVKDKERTNEIIFVDYKFGDYHAADKFLYSLKAYNLNKTNITYISHDFKLNLSHIERFKLAKLLLNKYARAKLVISTRIHGALPCLAFKTPVILINKDFDYDRFLGLYELLNTVGINSKKKFEIRVNIDENGIIFNSKKYLEYANKLKNQLKYI